MTVKELKLYYSSCIFFLFFQIHLEAKSVDAEKLSEFTWVIASKEQCLTCHFQMKGKQCAVVKITLEELETVAWKVKSSFIWELEVGFESCQLGKFLYATQFTEFNFGLRTMFIEVSTIHRNGNEKQKELSRNRVKIGKLDREIKWFFFSFQKWQLHVLAIKKKKENKLIVRPQDVKRNIIWEVLI